VIRHEKPNAEVTEDAEDAEENGSHSPLFLSDPLPLRDLSVQLFLHAFAALVHCMVGRRAYPQGRPTQSNYSQVVVYLTSSNLTESGIRALWASWSLISARREGLDTALGRRGTAKVDRKREGIADRVRRLLASGAGIARAALEVGLSQEKYCGVAAMLTKACPCESINERVPPDSVRPRKPESGKR